MDFRAFYIIIFLISVNTSLLSKDLSIEEFNELKTGLKSNEITIDQFNVIIDDLEISSEIFKISKDLFLDNAIELEDYLVVIENSLLSQKSLDSKITESEINETKVSDNIVFDGEYNFQTKITKLSGYITDMQYGQLFDHKIIFKKNNIKEINFYENNESVVRFIKPKLKILDNGKFNIKSNIIDPKDPSPLKYHFDGLINENLISGRIQILYNGNELPTGTLLLELEIMEPSVMSDESDSNNPNIADNNLPLKFKIVQVGNRVPPSINARVNNIENLIFVIDGNQVKEILYEDKSNNFFSKKIVRAFKNIKIKLVNQTMLKGRSKLVLNEYRSENIVIWWDLNISHNNPSGEVKIEIVGRGPQIKLIPVNN